MATYRYPLIRKWNNFEPRRGNPDPGAGNSPRLNFQLPAACRLIAEAEIRLLNILAFDPGT